MTDPAGLWWLLSLETASVDSVISKRLICYFQFLIYLPIDIIACVYQKRIRKQWFTAAQNLPQGTGFLARWKEEDTRFKQ